MILSYILMFLNTIYGFLVTPYILGCLGEGEYGVYKTIASLTAALLVVDLGIGSTTTRYIAKYSAENDRDQAGRYVGMNIAVTAVISGIVLLVSTVLFFKIGNMYSATFDVTQIEIAKKLFCVLVVLLICNLFENVFNGVIKGYGHFAFANGVKVVRLLLRVGLIFIVLAFSPSAIALVYIDLGLTLAIIVLEWLYIRQRLQVHICFGRIDTSLIKESMSYTLMIFLQAIVNQISGNIDNVVVGAYIGATAVTVYSMGLMMFNMFDNIALSVSSVLLPEITKRVVQGADNDSLTAYIIKIGRFQFALIGAAYMAFLIVGKEFYYLWLGDGYEDAWLIAAILMGSALIPLLESTFTTLLKAKNKLFFRTVTVFVVAMVNLLITVIGVKYGGYFYAALGTGFGYIFGHVIMLNIYYKKVLGFRPLYIIRKMFERIISCILCAGLVLFAANQFIYVSGVIGFCIKCALFLVSYFLLLYLYGFSSEEKRQLFSV